MGRPDTHRGVARLWACVPAVLLFLVAEAAAAPTARFIQPLDGSRVALPLTFQWNAADRADAYRLTLGTQPGGSDVLVSPETGALTWLATDLPRGQVLYARIWTRYGRVWRYDDARFVVPVQDVLLFNGATGELHLQFSESTSVSNADGVWGAQSDVAPADFNGDGLTDLFQYDPGTGEWRRLINRGNEQFEVSVGTWAPDGQVTIADFNGDGRDDAFLYNRETGEWLRALTVGESFQYARGLWGPRWRIHVADFNGDQRDDLFLYNGESAADPNSGRWYQVLSDSSGEFRYVEGRPRWASFWQIHPGDFDADGRSDLFLYDRRGGQWFLAMTRTTGFAYVGGLWGADWRIHAGDFNADRRTDLFLYHPVTGRWFEVLTRASGGFEYFEGMWGPSWSITPALLDGDGRTDLLLYSPSSGRYARALARGAGTFTYDYGYWQPSYTTVLADVSFSRAPATPILPEFRGTIGSTEPFTWTEQALASRYRLLVGTAPGLSDLHDSGPIQVTRRFVPGLPAGVPLYARIGTESAGQWSFVDTTFMVRSDPQENAVPAQLLEAYGAADRVHEMADPFNRPFGWTALYGLTTTRGNWGASCSEYAVTLLTVLREMNVTLPATVFNIAFNLNAYDTHTLVEIKDIRTGRWALLDPTFSLTVKRVSDGAAATAAEVSAVARSQRWADLQFVGLGAEGLEVARRYYIDYPLLFLNVLEGSGARGDTVSVLPYLASTTFPVSNVPGLYVLAADGVSISVIVDGAPTTIALGGPDNVTHVFSASSVSRAADGGTSIRALTPRRFVF